jgi:hypothetical protein
MELLHVRSAGGHVSSLFGRARFLVLLCAGLAIVTVPGVLTTAAESSRYAQWKELRAQKQRRQTIMDQAHRVRPRRRDAPLRYLNISDEEM